MGGLSYGGSQCFAIVNNRDQSSWFYFKVHSEKDSTSTPSLPHPFSCFLARHHLHSALLQPMHTRCTCPCCRATCIECCCAHHVLSRSMLRTPPIIVSDDAPPRTSVHLLAGPSCRVPLRCTCSVVPLCLHLAASTSPLLDPVLPLPLAEYLAVGNAFVVILVIVFSGLLLEPLVLPFLLPKLKGLFGRKAS
jgi:hypothetical protein